MTRSYPLKTVYRMSSDALLEGIIPRQAFAIDGSAPILPPTPGCIRNIRLRHRDGTDSQKQFKDSESPPSTPSRYQGMQWLHGENPASKTPCFVEKMISLPGLVLVTSAQSGL